jgi:hypothetical protein
MVPLSQSSGGARFSVVVGVNCRETFSGVTGFTDSVRLNSEDVIVVTEEDTKLKLG